jgi:hypothetical protein
MLRRKIVTALGTFALALILPFGATSLQAAACKGLEMESCQKNDSCSWVKPYERSDGVKVAGYCRSKPSKSGTSGSTEESDSKKPES